MKLFVIGGKPPLKWYALLMALVAVGAIALLLALRVFIENTYHFELFLLAAATLMITAIAWDYIARFPVMHIETRLTSAGVEGAIRFAETCPLNRKELGLAVNGFLMARSAKKEPPPGTLDNTGGETIKLSEAVKQAQENGDARKIVI